MSKGKDSKKADKKEPAKTAKEKKAEKREKKANKDKFWLKTLWKSANESRCSGLMRIMIFIMPASFKKQSFEYMEDFKSFAEAEASKIN